QAPTRASAGPATLLTRFEPIAPFRAIAESFRHTTYTGNRDSTSHCPGTVHALRRSDWRKMYANPIVPIVVVAMFAASVLAAGGDSTDDVERSFFPYKAPIGLPEVP